MSGGQPSGGTDPMYCPECDQILPENWDPIDERWRCGSCGSQLYENKEDYIEVTHEAARFQKDRGWGPWYDGDNDRSVNSATDQQEGDE